MISSIPHQRAFQGISPAEINRLQRGEAPSPSKLQEFSKTTVGKVLGCHSAKVAGGILLGMGVAGLILGTGGFAAIGLLAVGLAVWLGSTTVSTAALHDKGYAEQTIHVLWSLTLGVAGFFGGVLSVGGAGAALATAAPNLVTFGNGFQVVAIGGGLLDAATVVNPERNERSMPDFGSVFNSGRAEHYERDAYQHPDMQAIQEALASIHVGNQNNGQWPDVTLVNIPIPWTTPALKPQDAMPPGSPAVITSLNSTLMATFNENSAEAIVCQSRTGQSVALHMDGGVDLISADAIAGSDLEWIAVMRQASPAVYDVMQLSTYERLMTDDTGVRRTVAPKKQPITRIDMSDSQTIRGQELITLLDTARENPSLPPPPPPQPNQGSLLSRWYQSACNLMRWKH